MAARKSFLLLLANLSGSVIGAIATYVVAHRMGPRALGTIGYVMGLVGVTALVGDLGYSQAHLRYAAGKRAIGDSVRTYAAIIAVLTVAQLLLLILAPQVTQWLGRQSLSTGQERIIYVAFGFGVLMTGITRLFSTTYYAQEQVAKASLALILASLAVGLAQISVAVSGLGVVALAIAYQVEPAVRLVTLWLTSRGIPLGRPRASIARRYTRYAAPIAVRTALSGIFGNVDKVLLEWLSSTEQVGFYTGNLGTAAAINRVSVAATRVFFPRTVSDIDQGDFASANRRLDALVRYLLLLSVPVVALVIAYSEPIVRLTLGGAFLASAPTLSILAIAALLRMITAPYTNMLLALDKQAYLVPVSIVSAGVLIVGDAFLIPAEVAGLGGAGLGSAGAATALVIATISSLAMQVGLTMRLSGARPSPSLLWFVLGGVLMLAIQRTPSLVGADVGIVGAALLALISCVVFLLLALVTRQVSTSELRMMLQAANSVHLVRYVRRELNPPDDVA